MQVYDGRDLLVASAMMRHVRDTTDRARQPAHLGAPTIAITDCSTSPLARRAELMLLVATEGIQSSSVVAPTAVSEALAAIALRDPERSMRTLDPADTMRRLANLRIERDPPASWPRSLWSHASTRSEGGNPT